MNKMKRKYFLTARSYKYNILTPFILILENRAINFNRNFNEMSIKSIQFRVFVGIRMQMRNHRSYERHVWIRRRTLHVVRNSFHLAEECTQGSAAEVMNARGCYRQPANYNRPLIITSLQTNKMFLSTWENISYT